MSDYLHECLERHGDVTRALFGSRQDLQEVERLSSGIVRTGRLTYDDIETITDAGLWRGDRFWQWPTREEFDERCEHRPLDGLSVLPKRRKAIIGRLLDVFRHIEPVSVVLRFIDPKNFGILSPPVEKLLEIGPSHNLLEKYLKYVKDLQYLRDHRAFHSAAEVDMALWVVREAIQSVESRSDRLKDAVPEHREWVEAFWSDRMLRDIRVRNLTESLFGTVTLAQLAEALMSGRRMPGEQDRVKLAARIAGIEFEQAVMQVARARATVRRDERDKPPLMSVVNNLGMQPEIKTRWQRAVRTRNAAVHSYPPLTRAEVDKLLVAMREAINWTHGLIST